MVSSFLMRFAGGERFLRGPLAGRRHYLILQAYLFHNFLLLTWQAMRLSGENSQRPTGRCFLYHDTF